MTDVKLSHDRRGMGELLRSEMMLRVVVRRAELIRALAEATAPVGDERDPHRGRYKASFHIRSSRRGGATRDRAEAIVSNDAPEAVFVEWGHYGREPYHTLFRAGTEAR
jgi:hypothetical protein